MLCRKQIDIDIAFNAGKFRQNAFRWQVNTALVHLQVSTLLSISFFSRDTRVKGFFEALNCFHREPFLLWSLAAMAVVYEQVDEALRYLRPRIPAELRGPVIGIICGSGLSGLVDTLIHKPQLGVPYNDIPHFRPSTGREQASSASRLKWHC
jgi:hypothetical protein